MGFGVIYTCFFFFFFWSIPQENVASFGIDSLKTGIWL